MSNILTPEDPAFQRYERLVDALGTGPAHTAYESAALARIVSWSPPDDCAARRRFAANPFVLWFPRPGGSTVTTARRTRAPQFKGDMQCFVAYSRSAW
ncbi:MAG TPA: hypothetical protein VGK55_00635 [Actinomycetes bacterium]